MEKTKEEREKVRTQWRKKLGIKKEQRGKEEELKEGQKKDKKIQLLDRE